jgi:hypothetical protein
MNRTDLINHLIRSRRLTSYLEIGMHGTYDNFDQVCCTQKTCAYPSSADEFFTQNTCRYDIILLDGVHTESQCKKDIDHALDCLMPGGVIIIHDCMPPDAWHQREPELYHEGENWNGTTWKATLRYFNESPYKCFLLDMDWGCGIIDSSQSQTPQHGELPDMLNYAVHFPQLLRYKCMPGSLLREQVTVFYHLACLGNWKEVFEEQLIQLHRNGFQYINLTVLGAANEREWALDTTERLEVQPALLLHSEDLTCFETLAMKAIESWARGTDGYALYLHSKGVSYPAHLPKMKWRRLMMRELVEKWEQCFAQLPHYDVIGVNWRDMPPVSHFAGNFWYASTRYLRKLADFTHYYDHPRHKIWDSVNDKRLGCEFWIGSASEKPRVLSLVCRNVDFCNDNYWLNK